MNKTLSIICLGFMFINPFCVAQDQDLASINGVIKDAKTGEYLLAANIAVQETQIGISSNSDGFFSIDDIKPGNYTLVCSYVGYQIYREKIELKEGERLRLEVELVPKNQNLDEIVIKYSRSDIERSSINGQIVEIDLINDLPVFESDVFQSMQLLPGIQASSDFSSNLYVRGGSPDQTLILLDNAPVFNPTHFLGFFSTFNPDVIKEVRLYKGAYPAKFGGRLGSVLQIKTKDGNQDRVAGSVTASMLASRLALEGPLGNGSWQIAGRRSTIGPVLNVLRESTSGIPDTYHFFDLNGNAVINLSQKGQLSFNFYGGNDHVIFPLDGASAFNMDYGNRAANISWRYFPSDKFFATFNASGSHYFKQSNFDIAGSSNGRTNEILDYSFSSDFEFSAGTNNYLTAGISAGISEIELLDITSATQSYENTIRNPYATAYLQNEWSPGNKWKFTPGVRFSYYQNGDYKQIEPRFTAEFIPSNRLRFHASYGRYNQFLSLMTNEAFTGFDVWLPTSQNLKPSNGNQYVIGARTVPFKSFGFYVELYYRDMQDLFELDPFLPDWAGLAYNELFRIGEGNSYGMEVMFEKRAGKITGFIGYSLGYSWRKFPGYNIQLMTTGAEERFYPPKYDRRHDLTFVLNYELTNKWEFTTVFTYASGQAYTKVLGRYATINMPLMPEGKRQNVFTVGRVNASRLPDYHRLDVSIARKGSFFNFGKSELQLQLINVYSRRNIWYYNYYFQPNPIKQMEITLLPILPALSYSINF